MKNTGLYLQWDANQGVVLHHSALLVTKLCCWHFHNQHPFRVDRISLLYCILVSVAYSYTWLDPLLCLLRKKRIVETIGEEWPHFACGCQRRLLWPQPPPLMSRWMLTITGGWPHSLPWVHLRRSSCLGQGICFPPSVAGQKLKGWVDKALVDGWECTFWATLELELSDVMKLSWYLLHHYLAAANVDRCRSVSVDFFLISGCTINSPIICPNGQYTWSLHGAPCHQSD